MCEFISWVKKRGKVYFVTGEQLFSEKGQAWVKEHGVSNDDLCGHGTIRLWHGIDNGDGQDEECTNFSTPAAFPDVIVKAIKDDKMRGLGTPKGLLSEPAWAEYKKVQQQAWAEYKKVKQQALAEYEKVKQQAWAEYEKVEQPALAEYKKVQQQAWAEYKKVEQPAFWNLFAIPENRSPLWR